MNDKESKRCLFRNNNGMKCCYPEIVPPELKLGEVVTEPLRSSDGKYHKMQVVKCKWPDCI